jgi:hypothetical protein
MTEHETVRGLLILAMAGVLDPEEQSRMERHVHECEICSAEMEAWKVYASGLREMPQPATPGYLAERTQIRVLREQETRAERRQNTFLIPTLSLFGWAMSFALWFVLRVSMGDAMVMQTSLLRPGLWALVWTVVVSLSGATAAVVLAKDRKERRTAYDSLS